MWWEGGKLSYCHSSDALTKEGAGTSRWEAYASQIKKRSKMAPTKEIKDPIEEIVFQVV